MSLEAQLNHFKTIFETIWRVWFRSKM